jgi:tRNA (cmo5U34)-methyltransferase
MAARTDTVWQSAALVQHYLRDVRSGVPLAAEQIDVMMRVISSGDGPITSFLDLGCGGGILAAAILSQFPGAFGVLLDFSPPMIEAARDRLEAHATGLQFVTADYADPAWTGQVAAWIPFDAIVSGYSIHHQPDERKRSLYAELYEMLAPGGFFVNVEHVSSRSRWAESLWETYLIDSLHKAAMQNGDRKSREQVAGEFYARPDRGTNILAPVEAQCSWLQQIGFVDVDCYFKVFELAVFGGRRPGGPVS